MFTACIFRMFFALLFAGTLFLGGSAVRLDDVQADHQKASLAVRRIREKYLQSESEKSAPKISTNLATLEILKNGLEKNLNCLSGTALLSSKYIVTFANYSRQELEKKTGQNDKNNLKTVAISLLIECIETFEENVVVDGVGLQFSNGNLGNSFSEFVILFNGITLVTLAQVVAPRCAESIEFVVFESGNSLIAAMITNISDTKFENLQPIANKRLRPNSKNPDHSNAQNGELDNWELAGTEAVLDFQTWETPTETIKGIMGFISITQISNTLTKNAEIGVVVAFNKDSFVILTLGSLLRKEPVPPVFNILQRQNNNDFYEKTGEVNTELNLFFSDIFPTNCSKVPKQIGLVYAKEGFVSYKVTDNVIPRTTGRLVSYLTQITQMIAKRVAPSEADGDSIAPFFPPKFSDPKLNPPMVSPNENIAVHHRLMMTHTLTRVSWVKEITEEVKAIQRSAVLFYYTPKTRCMDDDGMFTAQLEKNLNEVKYKETKVCSELDDAANTVALVLESKISENECGFITLKNAVAAYAKFTPEPTKSYTGQDCLNAVVGHHSKQGPVAVLHQRKRLSYLACRSHMFSGSADALDRAFQNTKEFGFAAAKAKHGTSTLGIILMKMESNIDDDFSSMLIDRLGIPDEFIFTTSLHFLASEIAAYWLVNTENWKKVNNCEILLNEARQGSRVVFVESEWDGKSKDDDQWNTMLENINDKTSFMSKSDEGVEINLQDRNGKSVITVNKMEEPNNRNIFQDLKYSPAFGVGGVFGTKPDGTYFKLMAIIYELPEYASL